MTSEMAPTPGCCSTGRSFCSSSYNRRTAAMSEPLLQGALHARRLLSKVSHCARRVAHKSHEKLLFHSSHKMTHLLRFRHGRICAFEEPRHVFYEHCDAFIWPLRLGLQGDFNSLLPFVAAEAVEQLSPEVLPGGDCGFVVFKPRLGGVFQGKIDIA
ncbi:hypothetical protein V5799_031550 [Amblyomma americanum]|uniref:Uncharacterized protein n=1 Tax=Amblyomma americanum TaxID=6943 RepID=A0AAQ4EK18_AMBAM